MAHTYPPVGECIYCGAKEYAPGSARRLAKEHIIPLRIGGNIILPESSCEACERVTGRMESIALNEHLRAPRRRLGLKGRTRKSKQSKQIPLGMPDEGAGERYVDVDATDHPGTLFLPIFHDLPVAQALMGIPIKTFGGFWISDDWNRNNLEEKYGVTDWVSDVLDQNVFCRMIAKIAHGYAVAERGLRGFNPILKNMLRDPNRKSSQITHYVGGIPPQSATRALHTLRLRSGRLGSTEIIGVDVRLFAHLGAPTYGVLVGTPVGHFLPPHLCIYDGEDAQHSPDKEGAQVP